MLWTLALLFVPGLGLTDVIEALAPTPRPAKMVTTAYAIVVGGLLPASLLILLRRPELGMPALRQVAAAAAAFAITALISLRPADAFGAAFLLLVLLTTRAAHPLRATFTHLGRRSIGREDAPLMAGGAAWLALGMVAAGNQRAGLPPREGFSLGPDSWDAISVLALTVVLLVGLALRSFSGRRLHTASAGASSLAYGLASLWRQGIPGSLPVPWAGAAVVWGGVLAGLAMWGGGRKRRGEARPPSGGPPQGPTAR